MTLNQTIAMQQGINAYLHLNSLKSLWVVCMGCFSVGLRLQCLLRLYATPNSSSLHLTYSRFIDLGVVYLHEKKSKKEKE